MKIRRVDPRDTVWEQDHARYRVYFWDVPRLTAHEFEVAEDSDADAVLAWAREYAARHGWNHTVYVVVQGDDGPGLVRLAGILGDPFAHGARPKPSTASRRRGSGEGSVGAESSGR